MISPNPLVDPYFADGCGRCKLVGTPECKVHNWREELQKLRAIMLASGLKEERKWGVPCYTFQNSNIALISAFKASCALSFFKGALLDDPKGILVMPGENSQATRYICFTSSYRSSRSRSTPLSAYHNLVQSAVFIIRFSHTRRSTPKAPRFTPRGFFMPEGKPCFSSAKEVSAI